MENVMSVAFCCYFLLITAVTDGQQVGDVEIENCKDGFIDIRDNGNNTILCRGFDQRGTLFWKLTRNDKEITVATCFFSYCTVHQPDHFAVQWSPPHSTLFYQQYDRQVDKHGMVTCALRLGSSYMSQTCTVNVINPAMLSSCAVEEDIESRTVRGSCRFDHAYSFTRGFHCAWYQEQLGESKRFRGDITYDSGPQSPGGVCTFTSTDLDREPGTYIYIINFYPGPGNITVNVSKIVTNRPMSTRGTTPATSSPDLSSPTNNADYTSPKTQEEVKENDLPVGAIAGGIVGVVAFIIIIVVVVVVVFIRRKRRQKTAGSANRSRHEASNENDDFEEHMNPMYDTSDGQDDTHTTDHKPAAIARPMSPNSHTGHPAAPHSLDADIYTTVDGEARHAPSSAADRFGGNEDIGFGSNGNKRVPQKDEYAVVDKSRAKKGPESSKNTSASSPTHTTEGNNQYAVVDKSSSRNKAAKKVSSGLSGAATSNAGADVYAQVNKPAKKVKVAEPETEGAAYAQVQKPKPAVKPKTSVKPSSNKDATQRSAADDDEYHTLRHTRGSPETQEQADLESQYSHIGHD